MTNFNTTHSFLSQYSVQNSVKYLSYVPEVQKIHLYFPLLSENQISVEEGKIQELLTISNTMHMRQAKTSTTMQKGKKKKNKAIGFWYPVQITEEKFLLKET